MTATDELRRLLDERGVEWKDYGYENHTWWGEWHAENRPSVNGLFLKVEGVVTPAQAIDATLGRGTCRNVGYYIDGTRFKCSACGYNGWTKYAADGNDRVPNYCPNCGREVVDE